MGKAALGVGAAMAGSVREFYVWNREAARAWTMMDVGAEGFAAIRKEISKLSPELGVAKSELGKGWYQALSAGVAKDQLIPFLRTAAKVAVADGSSIETAIDGITTVLNAYARPASDAAAVTDQMFNAVVAGKTTFSEIASYIAQAAPAASAMGIGVDQILAAMVSLTKQGVPSSRALIQIRNIMLELNSQLGDGWGATMSFQDGLEKVGQQAGYSATALEKIFGKENISGVLALIGKNAAGTAKDLADMRAQTGSLDKAFIKVDAEIGHWPKVWQSVRSLVGDVGESIDTRLRPAINFVSQKLLALRESGGFSAFIDKLGSAVKSSAEALIAGVQTAVDLLGKASVGGLISGAVNALVDMAVTLIAEGLRSMGTIMVALAKVFSSALAADFMKMDLPFRDEESASRESALKKIRDISPDQASALGIPSKYAGIDYQSADAGKRREMKDWASGLSQDQSVKIATASRDADIDAAVTQAFERFSASRSRMAGAGERIVNNLGARTGVDISALYDANLGRTRQSFGSPSPQSAQVAPALPQASQGQANAAVQQQSNAGAIQAAAQQAADTVAQTNALMAEAFANINRELQKQKQVAADAAARAKQPGG